MSSYPNQTRTRNGNVCEAYQQEAPDPQLLTNVKSGESQVVLVKREREMMIQQSFSAGACTYPLEHRPPANQQMNGNGNY